MFSSKNTRSMEAEMESLKLKYSLEKKKSERLESEALALRKEKSKLQSELFKKENEIEDLAISVPKLDYGMMDPEPSDRAARIEYVARTAGFFQDILRKKIEHMISGLQHELCNPLNTERRDALIKDSVNALSLLLDWGDAMVAEHMSNISNSDNQ